MIKLNNENGSIKPLITIMILFVLAYTGYKFAIPYYKYSMLKSSVKEFTLISLGREDKLRNMIYNRAKELNAPVSNNNISVQNLGNSMHVSISWTDSVDLMGIYRKKIDFNINITE